MTKRKKELHEFFTLPELKEIQSSFLYGSYSSCGDPDQPIIRASISRKIREAITAKQYELNPIDIFEE
tara:strand:+ start:217 stop:420 length:204 start_codon:yes stop_codon:yes gene_type:complete